MSENEEFEDWDEESEEWDPEWFLLPDVIADKRKIYQKSDTDNVEKQGWTGPFTGPRGGKFMKDPQGRPEYDQSKWPHAKKPDIKSKLPSPYKRKRSDFKRGMLLSAELLDISKEPAETVRVYGNVKWVTETKGKRGQEASVLLKLHEDSPKGPFLFGGGGGRWGVVQIPIKDDSLRLEKSKKVQETEEVVVATFGSTPWSEDKPPRPDRPKKKEKVVIAEYDEKKEGKK